MNYVMWFNKCKSDDRSLAARLSNATSADLVRFVAWSSGEAVSLDRLVCACDKCNRRLSLVVLRCTERTLDTALDAEPVLIERVRHSDEYCNNAFVHYSFAHPSAIDTDALLHILAYTDARLLYVTTTYDTVTGSEDASVFKINIVRRKTPDCEKHDEWVAGRIREATHCTSHKFETRYVSYFSPYTGDGRAIECPLGFADRTWCFANATVPRAIESLHVLQHKERNKRRNGVGARCLSTRV